MIKWITTILLISYFGVKLLFSVGFGLHPFFNAHFSDLICVPIILGIGLYFMRWFRSEPAFYLNGFMIFYIAALYSVLFEWILPSVSSTYTADVVDVGMYFSGGLIYFLIQLLDQTIERRTVSS